METRTYAEHDRDSPREGRHVLACFDQSSIVVYQAYKPSIAKHALEHGVLGGPEFSFRRMSWIKPSFLWMMYRSGWATKESQEAVLAFRIRREFFDRLLRDAVRAQWDRELFATQEQWQDAVRASDVRVQWDPDHDPRGAPLERRAIQLGLRGRALEEFGTRAIVSIEDMTPFIESQRERAARGEEGLLVPVELPYPILTPPSGRD